MKKEHQTPIVRFGPLKLETQNSLYRVTQDDEIVSLDFEPTERTVIKADYSGILHNSLPDKFMREYAVWDINKIEKNERQNMTSVDNLFRIKTKKAEYCVKFYKRQHSFLKRPHFRFNYLYWPHMRFLVSINWRWHTLSVIRIVDWRKVNRTYRAEQ